MKPSERFVAACRGQPVDRPPVWLMRQAGRYLPEYRKVREKHSFLTLCRTPELAAEVTLQPVERFGMDAAILFSDILLILEAMGVDLRFDESQGPQLARSGSLEEQIAGLRVPDPEAEMGYVFETLRQVRGALGGKAAVIGFSGAPFTLASYVIEEGSSRNYYATKRFMYQEPASFHRLMELLVRALVPYLAAQVRAGAEALQVFDTWATILAPADYVRFVLPWMKELFSAVRDTGAPLLHFSLGTSTLLGPMAEIGADVLSLDWKMDIGEARERLGSDRPVQGNLDPFALFRPEPELREAVRAMISAAGRWPGYIFNLGHGIHPKTPVDGVQALVDTVRGRG